MPYRKSSVARRKLMLFPLMDMFFILLLYFLVTTGISRTSGVKEMPTAVPVEGTGEAQILLQVVDANSVLWLDNTSFHEQNWQGDNPASYVIPVSKVAFEQKLRRIYRTYGKCLRHDVLAVIRCPNNLMYADILALQDSLSAAFEAVMRDFTLEYSLLEGEFNSATQWEVQKQNDDEVDLTW